MKKVYHGVVHLLPAGKERISFFKSRMIGENEITNNCSIPININGSILNEQDFDNSQWNIESGPSYLLFRMELIKQKEELNHE